MCFDVICDCYLYLRQITVGGARRKIGEIPAIGHWRDSQVIFVTGKILSIQECTLKWEAAQE